MRKRPWAQGVQLPAFGMSFLDVMACGFAAAVLLLVLAKEDPEEFPVIEESDRRPDTVREHPDELKGKLNALIENRDRLATRLAELEFQRVQNELRAEALSAARVKLSQQLDDAPSAAADPMLYESGVPVGFNYVLFIVDTSGSMQQHWGTVVETLTKILEMHPSVTGLQILDDNGGALIEGYEGVWIPDTKAARKNALRALKQMGGFSNSSPAEGLEKALKVYAKPRFRSSIYVLGDDFTGSSYDSVLAVVERWNTGSQGKPKAIIHGIGFPWGLGARYSPLMTEIARSSGGVFIGL